MRSSPPCSTSSPAGCSASGTTTRSSGHSERSIRWLLRRRRTMTRTRASMGGRSRCCTTSARRRVHDHVRQPAAPQRVEPRHGSAVLRRPRSRRRRRRRAGDRAHRRRLVVLPRPRFAAPRAGRRAGRSAPRRTPLAALRAHDSQADDRRHQRCRAPASGSSRRWCATCGSWPAAPGCRPRTPSSACPPNTACRGCSRG